MRLPDGMREQISALAKANNRSMNAEIVGILQDAIAAKKSNHEGIDINRLADALANRLAEKLKVST